MIHFVRFMSTINYVEIWQCDCGNPSWDGKDPDPKNRFFVFEYEFGFIREDGTTESNPEAGTVINKPVCPDCGETKVSEDQHD